MGLIGTALWWVLGVAGAVIIATLSRLLADDFKLWSPRLIDWLTRRAVNLLPEDHRERLHEEWRSHLDETPSELGKLTVAGGYVWAASVISIWPVLGRIMGDVVEFVRQENDRLLRAWMARLDREMARLEAGRRDFVNLLSSGNGGSRWILNYWTLN